jgi:hypothetical protein
LAIRLRARFTSSTEVQWPYSLGRMNQKSSERYPKTPIFQIF